VRRRNGDFVGSAGRIRGCAVISLAPVEASAAEANKVIDQSVAQDTKVDPATTSVALTVGAPVLRVPSLVGLAYAEAMLKLSQLQFHNVQADNRPVQNVNPGFVSAQVPEAGTEAQADAAIRLTVAAQLIPVPQVTGMTFGNAVIRLRQFGLDYGTIRGVQADGIVQQQSPAVNASVPLGTKVDLTLPGCYIPAQCYTISQAVSAAALSKNTVYMNNLRIAQPIMGNKILPQ